MAQFRKVTPGTGMGCTDMSGPESYSEEQLSRMHDMLVNAELVFGNPFAKEMWDRLPLGARHDYIWSGWSYVA